MTAEDLLNADPIPTTRATLNAWAWITREKSWIEGLVSLTVTEWTNDDRLLADQGGDHSTRMARRWIEDMGIKMKDMPNFSVHAEADVEHSDMFLPDFPQFTTDEKEGLALQAVQELLDILAIYHEGAAKAMEKLP